MIRFFPSENFLPTQPSDTISVIERQNGCIIYKYLILCSGHQLLYFLQLLILIFYFYTVKVPSGQIRSAWEWYHWIGQEKGINHYRFLIFLLTLNSEPLHTKIHLIILLLRQAGFMCTNHNLFIQTGPQKCRPYPFFVWRTARSRTWRISTIRNSNQNSAAHWRVFSSNKSVPVNRKQSFYTSGLTKNEEIACIFIFQKFMIKI